MFIYLNTGKHRDGKFKIEGKKKKKQNVKEMQDSDD